MNTAGEAGEKGWMHIGRDGEPVTLEEKLEQVMQFGDVMERLAIENNARALDAESRLARAEALAGLATELAATWRPIQYIDTDSKYGIDWLARYDALAGGDAPGSEEEKR